VLNFQIIQNAIEREPSNEQEGECFIPFRAFPTELEFNYHD